MKLLKARYMMKLLETILWTSSETDIKTYVWDYKPSVLKLLYALELTGHIVIVFGEVQPSYKWIESMGSKTKCKIYVK